MANSGDIVSNQTIDKSIKSLKLRPLKHNNQNPFSEDELKFLESHYISVDLDNCVGRGTFGTLYVALSHWHSYVVIKRYESYREAFCLGNRDRIGMSSPLMGVMSIKVICIY